MTPPPDLLELEVERPVAGGRMLARHGGQVVFVAGAVPGERVRARVERQKQKVLFATVTEVIDASPDRRDPAGDPVCGGMTYSHVRYERQLRLKSEIVADAFRRIARVPLPAPVAVAASPERGYRLRARFHLAGRRAVFFREGTHQPCDAAATGQLTSETMAAVGDMTLVLSSALAGCRAMDVAESITGLERAIHLVPREAARLEDLQRVDLPHGITGLTTTSRNRLITLAGTPTVTDTADQLFAGDSPIGSLPAWTRRASSFFQGNRFLTGALVRRVLDLAEGDRCVDLYAGVGLFAVALAARGARVLAVEGDRSSAADLEANAGPWREHLRVIRGDVEAFAAERLDPPPDAVVVDPPRTGLSPQALAGVTSWQASRLVYVSCDAPTLARDVARLVQAGYHLQAVESFDLFPNTPHIETIAVLSR